MRYIFVLVLLSFSLFANSIVDIYRDSGIKAVEAYIQKQLESKKYQDEKLQNKSSNSIVIVSENDMKDVEKFEIAILLSELFRWQRTWRDNDIEEYLDFYDKDFKRYDDMSRKTFQKEREIYF